MSKNFKWSCTACGMSSSRRFSVQRHIGNIHQGFSTAIPFVEYLIGRREGKYPPQKAPQFTASQTPFADMIVTEVEKDFAKKVANRINPPEGPAYDNMASMVKTYWFNKFIKETSNDST